MFKISVNEKNRYAQCTELMYELSRVWPFNGWLNKTFYDSNGKSKNIKWNEQFNDVRVIGFWFFGVTTWRPKYHLQLQSIQPFWIIKSIKLNSSKVHWWLRRHSKKNRFGDCTQCICAQHTIAYRITNNTIKSANQIKVGKPLLRMNRDIETWKWQKENRNKEFFVLA